MTGVPSFPPMVTIFRLAAVWSLTRMIRTAGIDVPSHVSLLGLERRSMPHKLHVSGLCMALPVLLP